MSSALNSVVLTSDLRHALIPALVASLASTLASALLLGFIINKSLRYKGGASGFYTYHQFLALLGHLILANLLEAVAFSLSLNWIRQGSIVAPSTTCSAQGLIRIVADNASGIFILLIGLHTFLTNVTARRVGPKTLGISIVAAWSFALVIAAIGPSLHAHDFFAPIGGWCWINGEYPIARIMSRFVWVLSVECLTIIIYTIVFINEKRIERRTKAMTLEGQSTPHGRMDRVARYMALFPLSYIVLTMPLSASRLHAARSTNKDLPTTTLVVGMTFVASSGWVNSLLYVWARSHLLSANSHVGKEQSVQEFSTKATPSLARSKHHSTVEVFEFEEPEERKSRDAGSMMRSLRNMMIRKQEGTTNQKANAGR